MSEFFEEYGGVIAITLTGCGIMMAFITAIIKIAEIGM